MKLDEVIVSYPCKQYDMEIIHFTSRKSTAMEWIILEVVQKFSNDLKYNIIPVAQVFERILHINDSDLLIKPCIEQLLSLGAITIYGFNDNSTLSEITLGDIQMTDIGTEMQKKGLLPGEESEAHIIVNYDIVENKLMASEVKLSSKLMGKTIMEVEEYEEEYPRNLIIRKLEQDRKKGTYAWLQLTTEVKDINKQSEKVLWRNYKRDVELSSNGYLSINNVPGEYVHRLIFDKLEQDIWADKEFEWLMVEPMDIDDEYTSIYFIENIPQQMAKLIYNDKIVAIHSDFWFPECKTNNRSTSVIMCFNSPEWQSELRTGDKAFILQIPETMPLEGAIALGKDRNVFGGMFDLYTDVESIRCKLAYSKAKFSEVNMSQLLKNIVDKYYLQDYKIATLYLLDKNEASFKESLRNILSQTKDLNKQIEILEEITDICTQLGNKKINTDVLLLEKVKEKVVVKNHLVSLEEVKESLEEISNNEYLKSRDSVKEQVVKSILPRIEYTLTHNQVKELFDYFIQTKLVSKRWFILEGLLDNIYTTEVIQNLFESFLETKQIIEYTELEQVFNGMKNIYTQLTRLCGDLDLTQHCNREDVVKLLIDKPNDISNIYRQLKSWKGYKNKLVNKVAHFEEILNDTTIMNKIEININLLQEIVGIFVNDTALKYSEIYVIDSSSILNKPELIDIFNTKDLVILPTVVLEELDGLKNGENKELAYKAREIIRTIPQKENIQMENAYPELLPIDLSQEINDNLILSIALKYIIKEPKLITEDMNLKNVAKAQHIQTISVEEVCKSKQEQLKTMKEVKQKGNKGNKLNKENKKNKGNKSKRK